MEHLTNGQSMENAIWDEYEKIITEYSHMLPEVAIRLAIRNVKEFREMNATV